MFGDFSENSLKHFITELFLAHEEADKEACRNSAVALGVSKGMNREGWTWKMNPEISMVPVTKNFRVRNLEIYCLLIAKEYYLSQAAPAPGSCASSGEGPAGPVPAGAPG